MWGWAILPHPRYDNINVSVGTGNSVALLESASVGGTQSTAGLGTVTEAGGGLEVGARGATPWESREGSWEGSRGGNGARPGMFRGGSEARGGTGEKNKNIFFN